MAGLGSRSIAAGVFAAVAALVVFGCAGARGHAPSASAPSRVIERARPKGSEKPAATLIPSHCPSSLSNCRAAAGWIVYVERVDPDGDGDAHFVILDSQSITLPGLTAIDVRKGLRPHPLPGIGDRISAAGPIETGSHGQSQIHALEVHGAG